MQDGVKQLIEQIRKEEREKILREIEAKKLEIQVKPFTEVSRHIDLWGEESEVPTRDLCKIKTAVQTIIRYSLGIRRMTHLEEEEIELAKLVVDDVLEIIETTK